MVMKMSDLIDRQAAIDALNTLFKKQVTQFGYEGYEKADEKTQLVCDGISYSIGCVLNLPSAQPQLDTCPIYGGMCGYPSNLCYECPRHEGAKERPQWWTEGLQPFAQPQRWIPVTERLPDEWKRVLIQNDEGLFLVGFVKDRGWGKEWFYQYEMYDYDAYEESEQGKIVAWCELPDPWKGEEE